MTLYDWLISLGACKEALNWVYEGDYTTLPKAWRECPRADWLLWLVKKNVGKPGWHTRKDVALAECDCAETVLKYVPKGEDRPRIAIETRRAWAVGEATEKECQEAAKGAFTAAEDAYFASAEDACFAAAVAASAHYSVGPDDDAADDASGYAADAVIAASHSYMIGLRNTALRKLATIVRRRLKPGSMG
jgi:hypothetical protein